MAGAQFDTTGNRDLVIGVHDLTFTGVQTIEVISNMKDTQLNHYPLFDFYIQPPGTDLWMIAPPQFNNSPYLGDRFARWHVDYYSGGYDVFGGALDGSVTKAKLIEYRSSNMELVNFTAPQEAKILFDSRDKSPKVIMEGSIDLPKQSGSGIIPRTITHNLNRIVDIKAWHIYYYDGGEGNIDDVYSMQPMYIDDLTWWSTNASMDLNSVTYYTENDAGGPGKIIWRIYEDA